VSITLLKANENLEARPVPIDVVDRDPEILLLEPNP